MTNIVRDIKKIILFLFGVILIISGYKVNAANNEAKIEDDKEEAAREAEVQPVVPTDEEPKVEAEPEPQVSQKLPVETKKPAATIPVKAESATSKPTEKKKLEKLVVEEVKTVVEEPKKVDQTPQTVIEKATPEEASGTE